MPMPDVVRHVVEESEEQARESQRNGVDPTELHASDGRKHRCRVCHLHVIPGWSEDSILGGRQTEDGAWEHFRCR
jgi:diadenosine tetraphosphate (Ap4A) HIT family hydrolase